MRLRDGSRGTGLPNIISEAGAPWGIGPGGPTWCERVESGLISNGGGTGSSTNPFDVRIGKCVDLQGPDDTTGITARRKIAVDCPKRHSPGIILDPGRSCAGGIPVEPALQGWQEGW